MMGMEGGNEEDVVRQPTNEAEANSENIGRALTIVSKKVTEYGSEYMDSSNHGSYEDTSEGSSVDDARRHRSRKNYYDPNVMLKDFFIGLQFENLKLFKGELVEFSTRK